MKKTKEILVALLRVSLGWIFLWAFMDKLYGLGFATPAENAWLNGASPTAGFLEFGTSGPFAGIFQSMAGSPAIDWLFMLGLLLIGAALILGIGMRIASYSGVLLMILMWLATLPPEHNPFMDDHIIYALILIGLTMSNAGDHYGLGKWWGDTKLVQKWKWLK